MICMASMAVSGIETRWWMKKLFEVQEQERQVKGLAFSYHDGSVMSLRELDSFLHYFLEKIQKEDKLLIAAPDNVQNLWFFLHLP